MASLTHLIRAAHAGPTLVVTVVSVLLTRAFAGSPGVMAMVGLAVLAGQLSIGWSNDAIDADRDRRVGRADKPAATGALPRPLLGALAAAAVGVSIVLSLLLGVRPGTVHIALVAMGWAYNLGLKSSPLSAVPYAVAFGLLPSVASLAAAGDWAPGWLSLAGAGIGVAAHVANCLPDLADDAATGVRGLPHRLGSARSRGLAATVLVGAVAAVVSRGGLSAPVVLVVAFASLACAAVVVVGKGRTPFVAIMGLAVLVVLLAADRLV